MLKMYLNTKYFLQMYVNNNYIDVFKYFLNTFLYYFQNIVLIHSIHYKFENERNIRHKISLIIQYVNNITIILNCSRPCELTLRLLTPFENETT